LTKISNCKCPKQLRRQQLESVHKQDKRVYDEIFAKLDRKFLISLTDGFHHSDLDNNQDTNFFDSFITLLVKNN
jgi:hypothetical protein